MNPFTSPCALAVKYCRALGIDPFALVAGYLDERRCIMPRWFWYRGARP